MPTTQAESPWLTIEQLAGRLQTTVAAVYKQRHVGKLPRAVKVGKELRWHIDDVTEWEKARRESA